MPLQEYEDYEEEYDQDPHYDDYYYDTESDSSTDAWVNFLGPWAKAYDESRKTTTPKQQHNHSIKKVSKARNITPRKTLSVIEEESAIENPKREPTKYHPKTTRKEDSGEFTTNDNRAPNLISENASLKRSIRHSTDRLNLKREPTKYHSKNTATTKYRSNPTAVQNYNQAPKHTPAPNGEPRSDTLNYNQESPGEFTTNDNRAPNLISENASLKISIRHSTDRLNLKREPTKYHSKNTATPNSNQGQEPQTTHKHRKTAKPRKSSKPRQKNSFPKPTNNNQAPTAVLIPNSDSLKISVRHSKDRFNPKREPTKSHSTTTTTPPESSEHAQNNKQRKAISKTDSLKISIRHSKDRFNPKREPTKYQSKTTRNFNQHDRKEEPRTPTKAQQAQNYKQKQAQQVSLVLKTPIDITKTKQNTNINESNIDNNNDNDNDTDNDTIKEKDNNDVESNPIINIKSWTSSSETYPNNLQATPLNSSAFYVTAFAQSQVKHMKPRCKKKKPPQFTLLKSRASPPDSTLINDYVNFQNLAFEHAMVHSHMNPSTDNKPYRLLTMLLPKSSKQTSLKKRKASEVEVTHQEITTSSKHKSFPIPVPVPAVTSSWKRPNLFTGGFANVIPFLESTFMDNSTIPIQKTKSANFQLAATTVLIRTLAYLAQPVIRINHLNCISTANRLLFPAIQAVPFVPPATETPFRSTGPGPPHNSINHLCPTRTTTCPYDTPKNPKTLPILCQPLHGSTHGNTDTSNAVLVSKNSTNVITPPPHENNTVSTPQKSKVNANADFHPAETETQENPNKNLKGGHKYRSKLVT